jgi:hypothetical protein
MNQFEPSRTLIYFPKRRKKIEMKRQLIRDLHEGWFNKYQELQNNLLLSLSEAKRSTINFPPILERVLRDYNLLDTHFNELKTFPSSWANPDEIPDIQSIPSQVSYIFSQWRFVVTKKGDVTGYHDRKDHIEAFFYWATKTTQHLNHFLLGNCVMSEKDEAIGIE